MDLKVDSDDITSVRTLILTLQRTSGLSLIWEDESLTVQVRALRRLQS